MNDFTKEELNKLPKYNNLECFEIISGQIPVYSFESRVKIANELWDLSQKEKISFKKAWDMILRQKYL